MRRRVVMILALLALLTPAMPAFAVNPDEVLNDPALESRARSLSTEIRCLVCQNQSIDDSDAQLARDLRVLVREKLTEGLSDDEILDYLVERYGEFVLLKPRFGTNTVVLWIAPFALLLIAGGVISLNSLRGRKVQSETPGLTEKEKSEISRLLDNSQ